VNKEAVKSLPKAYQNIGMEHFHILPTFSFLTAHLNKNIHVEK